MTHDEQREMTSSLVLGVTIAVAVFFALWVFDVCGPVGFTPPPAQTVTEN